MIPAYARKALELYKRVPLPPARIFRTPAEWVPVAEQLAEEHSGLPGTGWLDQNGYSGLGRAIEKHPALFAHIKRLRPSWRPFVEARKYVRTQNLSSKKAHQVWPKNDRPKDIPSNPNTEYKDAGWISWGDYLGTGNIAPQNRIFLPFKKARAYARSLKINGQAEWFQWCKAKKLGNIPAHAGEVYKTTGWISWPDFLGCDTCLQGPEHRTALRSAIATLRRRNGGVLPSVGWMQTHSDKRIRRVAYALKRGTTKRPQMADGNDPKYRGRKWKGL